MTKLQISSFNAAKGSSPASLDNGLLNLRHKWGSLGSADAVQTRLKHTGQPLSGPFQTSQYINQICPRKFISKGEVLPGTKGLVMGSTKEVIRTFPAPKVNRLSDKNIELDYGGLVHFCNNPKRVDEITNSTPQQSFASVQQYIFTLLERIQKPSRDWLIQLDPAKERVGYHVTVFRPNAFNQHIDAGEIIADRLILKDYGEKPYKLHVQTGFPVTKSKVELDASRLNFVGGTPFHELAEEKSPVIDAVKLQTSASEAVTPETQETREDVESSELTSVQTSAKPASAENKAFTKAKEHIFNLVDDLKDKVITAQLQMDYLKSLGVSKGQAGPLEAIGYPTQNLGDISKALSERKVKVLQHTDEKDKNAANYIFYQLLGASVSAGISKQLDAFRDVMTSLLVLEVEVDKFADSAKKMGLTLIQKNELQASYDDALEEYTSLHHEFTEFLSPLMIGVSDLIKCRTEQLQYQFDIFAYVSQNSGNEKKINKPEKPLREDPFDVSNAIKKISVALIEAEKNQMNTTVSGKETANQTKLDPYSDPKTVTKEDVSKGFAMSQASDRTIRLFSNQAAFFNANFISSKPESANAYLESLDQYASMLELQSKALELATKNSGTVDVLLNNNQNDIIHLLESMKKNGQEIDKLKVLLASSPERLKKPEIKKLLRELDQKRLSNRSMISNLSMETICSHLERFKLFDAHQAAVKAALKTEYSAYLVSLRQK